MRLRFPVTRDTLRKDAVAGLVLGVESVPDGLAAGLLAGVSPLSGLYAYLFGTIGGSFVTSSAFMAVQATGAMAIVIADVPAVHTAADPARALFTLSVLTGVVMLAAGFLRLGSVLRFVSNAVMVGFISAVGVNIILGQLANLTGYKAEGGNRVVRAVNTVIHPGELHLQSLAIGVLTVALILLLERTRLGPLGLVLAVVVTSALVAVLGGHSSLRLKVSRHFTPLLGEMAIRALSPEIGRYGCCVLTLLRFLTTFLRPIGHLAQTPEPPAGRNLHNWIGSIWLASRHKSVGWSATLKSAITRLPVKSHASTRLPHAKSATNALALSPALQPGGS